MTWLPYTLISVVFLGIFNVLLKLLPSRLSSEYVTVLIAVGAFVAGLLNFMYAKRSVSVSLASKEGILLALLCGLFWGVGTVLTAIMYEKGAPLSVAAPILLGGLLLFSQVFGVFLFKEPITITKIMGIISLLIGIGFLTRS